MSAARDVDRDVLRDVVETLAPLERRAGSADEHRAAEWIAERLSRAGAPAHVEDATFLDGYAPLIGGLAAVGAVAGVVGATRAGRGLAMVAGALAAAAIVDDVSNGPRVARRTAQRPKQTWNVVAEAGDRDAARTLVVMAHHDAAPSGAIFDQTLQRLALEKAPGLFERADTAVPVWWPVVGGPALAALGAKLRRPRLGLLGAALSAGSVAAMADISRSPIVQGANDNLSAVAALVGLAERLRAAEDRGDGVGVRVLLVSCGAEEVIQGGIHSFAADWFPRLDRERTWFLNLDTIGSPELVSIEGEGPIVMEDYHWRSFRDLVERVSWREGVPVRRGMRARSSTDAVVPSRAGYPTACLVSFDRAKAMPNYHLTTDVPENLDYDTVARAVVLAEAVARELAGDAAQTGVTERG